MKTHKQFVDELLKKRSNDKAFRDLEVEFKIYNALVRARIEKKLTQKELASRLGVAQSAIARFESGRTNPTLSFLQKVASGLGLKLTVI